MQDFIQIMPKKGLDLLVYVNTIYSVVPVMTKSGRLFYIQIELELVYSMVLGTLFILRLIFTFLEKETFWKVEFVI